MNTSDGGLTIRLIDDEALTKFRPTFCSGKQEENPKIPIRNTAIPAFLNGMLKYRRIRLNDSLFETF